MTTSVESWWRNGVFYQVYPRSFQDSNGDGVGDLKGVVQRLPYLQALGVDAIWLSPIFPSPMADFGYDIADYIGIDSLFGTLQDFDALMEAVHAKGLKIILDLVPNHTSDRHPWFIESRSSRENPKRDWYIWHEPGVDGGPPNNWLSEFGGSAWEYDAATGQFAALSQAGRRKVDRDRAEPGRGAGLDCVGCGSARRRNSAFNLARQERREN